MLSIMVGQACFIHTIIYSMAMVPDDDRRRHLSNVYIQATWLYTFIRTMRAIHIKFGCGAVTPDTYYIVLCTSACY